MDCISLLLAQPEPHHPPPLPLSPRPLPFFDLTSRSNNAFCPPSYLCHRGTYRSIADGGCVSSRPPGLTYEAENIAPTRHRPFAPDFRPPPARGPLPSNLLLSSSGATAPLHRLPVPATVVSRNVIYTSLTRRRAYSARRAVLC